MKELSFGYCDCVITPSAKIGLAGYEKRNNHGFGNSGVLDDLYAKALSLRCDGLELVLITLDLCIINEKEGDHIREKVSQKLQIPVENIMLNVSHTHSGPQTSADFSAGYPGAEKLINAYMEELTEKIVSISSQASSLDFKGKLYAANYNTRLAYNRRYTKTDANGQDQVKMLFTLWRNPEHETNGKVDANIPILLIERTDENQYDSYFAQAGCDRIVLFNVPAHPVVLGEDSRYVSADYPGAARRCLEKIMGDGTKTMFLLGACGDVNPLFACQNNPKAVEILGNAIGYGICSALSLRQEVEFDGLNVISENIKLRDESKLSRIVTQVFKIGRAAIAAVSCECFTELGIRIRNMSKFAQTLVAENSNGGGGYIPDREAWKTGKGYELASARKNGFDEDLLDRMAETVIKNMNAL